ncbi:MAG: PilZ domain-containing protein [Nitrospirae bacterium]|nr:PilZ domain-containing protein [Nitrospirota bacterium]
MNKRRHKRVPISATATLRFKEGNETQSVQTMAASIALGGIGVYSDNPVEIETDVSITIDFISSDGMIKSSSTEGRVVYDKTIGTMHFIGIQFDEELNAENQPALYEHLQKILSWNQ